MKDRICLIKINEPVDMNMPPLGLLYVGDALSKAGYEVKIHHLLPSEVEKKMQMIIKEEALFVGFSVFTGNCMKAYVHLSQLIKKYNKNTPVVWGNAHPSLVPEQCLQEDYIDMVCIGEGEVTAVELANVLKNKSQLSSVNGLGYKESGKPVINPPREFLKDLDTFSLNWDLVDIEQYIQPRWQFKRVLPVATSRGCPYSCGFCYNQKFNKRRWRAHSVDFIVSQLNRLKENYQLDGLLFLDDEFFVDKNRGFEIVEKVGLPYYANARVEYVDDEFARRLSDTQCRMIMFGLESGSNRVLKEIINKGSTKEDSIRAVEIISQYRQIEITVSFIFALPGEAFDEFRESEKLIIKLLKMHPNMSVSTGFYLPVPGTACFESALQKGFKQPKNTLGWHMLDKWTGSEFKLAWNNWITSADCIKLRKDFITLSLLYRYNIHVLKEIMAWRIDSGISFLPIDLWFIRLFWRLYSRWNTFKIKSLTKRKRKETILGK